MEIMKYNLKNKIGKIKWGTPWHTGEEKCIGLSILGEKTCTFSM